jgi:hypothetical protein
VQDICHVVVMTSDLRDEWKNHQSRFARKWLTRMHARRKVEDPGDVHDADLRKVVAVAIGSDVWSDVVEKDMRLIESALATDSRVLSCEEKVRRALQLAARRTGRIRGLMWTNPDTEGEALLDWLRTGCPYDEHRTLGYPASGRRH